MRRLLDVPREGGEPQHRGIRVVLNIAYVVGSADVAEAVQDLPRLERPHGGQRLQAAEQLKKRCDPV